MSTTAEAILEEDGADKALVQIAERVEEAEQVITSLLSQDKTRTWSVKDLQDAAAARKRLSPSIISIAFSRLKDAGLVQVDDESRAHAA
jgi:hypothetical protein